MRRGILCVLSAQQRFLLAHQAFAVRDELGDMRELLPRALRTHGWRCDTSGHILYPLFLIVLRRRWSYTLVRDPSLVKHVQLRTTQYWPHRSSKIDGQVPRPDLAVSTVRRSNCSRVAPGGLPPGRSDGRCCNGCGGYPLASS